MKLSTIIRAIVRPIVHVEAFDDAIQVQFLQSLGPGVIICDHTPSYGFPPRAREARLGGLHIRYWGRDTLVHPTEAS